MSYQQRIYLIKRVAELCSVISSEGRFFFECTEDGSSGKLSGQRLALSAELLLREVGLNQPVLSASLIFAVKRR